MRTADPTVDALVDRAALAAISAPPDRLDREIDSAASLLAASESRWPEVSRALLAYAERTIVRAWVNAWRPADLMRVVRRDLEAGHAALAADLIAAENRRHTEADLDRRWREQLAELGTEVWWGDDGGYLAGFARRHRLDRFAVATVALELLRLWGRLPPITPVGPVPGQARQAPRRQTAGPVTGESRALSRIRGLLAKAESTEYPDEAEALTAKAQQLMARHSIDEALLAASRPSKDEPGAVRIGVDGPYEDPKSLLLDAVAEANRCRAVWTPEFGFCTVVGFDADLDAIDLLYTSLLVQATAAMRRAGDERHLKGSRRTKAFRQSFLFAYADRIRERLTAATELATGDAAADRDGDTDRLLPVLAAREEAVDRTVDDLFGELVSQRIRIGDDAGWYEGRAAADSAVVH